MDFINDLFGQITGLGPEMLLALIVVVVGYMLRLVTWFPNRYIPVMCVVLGAVLWPSLVKPGANDLAMRHPLVRQILVGTLIGFLAWIGHNKFLAPLEDKIPWLKGVLEEGQEK